MIMLTRLNGTQIMVNAELIEFIEQTPDTVISMASGKKLIVTEGKDTVIERFIAYKRRIFPYVDYGDKYEGIEKVDFSEQIE